MNGFSLVARNGAGFDNHYLSHYLISDYGLTVDPIYSGSTASINSQEICQRQQFFDKRC